MLVRITDHDPTSKSFDYGQLDASFAQEAKAIAQRIHDRRTKAVIETGLDLAYVKERLKRGVFGKWLQAEFAMTSRTAQNYMLAAAVFGPKYEMISYLPPTLLYDLAPLPPLREALLEQLEAGERPHPKTIEEMVRRAKQERRQQRQDKTSVASRRLPQRLPLEECAKEVAPGQAQRRDDEVIVATDDVRAAAEMIVLGLGEKVTGVLQVLGKHSSITRDDLAEAAMRLSKARRVSALSSADQPSTADPREIPSFLDRRVNA